MTEGEQYIQLFPFSSELSEEQHFLCFDQAKTNLFYLVEPRVDTEGIEAARGNPIAFDIDAFMDATTRHYLMGLPRDFLYYWDEVDKQGDPEIAKHWPANYWHKMVRRAEDAHRRLLVVAETGNVVQVQFKRRA